MSRPIILRLDLFDGTTKFRPFDESWFRLPQEVLHGLLCKTFGLDPIRSSYDLPSTIRGVGSSMGQTGAGPRRISGYVMWPVENPCGLNDRRPIGKITVASESERFREYDPRNESDFYRLDRS